MPILIVGLGNPGKEYSYTRHNAGFIAIDKLLEKYGFQKKIDDFKAHIFFSNINNEKVLFVKPQTYMNLSGESIIAIMNYYKINIKDFLVIYDDKDLKLAELRFKEKGSAGGHNGIKNIIQHFKTENFNRLKIGIGIPPYNFKIVDWVLSKMSETEIACIEEKINKISLFIKEFIVDKNLLKIMNKYN
ncbi:aminoacyl-tRNA hydrolase [Spiroplasma taiwanense]|uniref:Peptidyl-tRNA hydrolase n=1 Tax=Spiroplasma taiwanense CT-1 TaxID=1276220 RepID=S5LYQ8_9MOLU|nr:aminoacyl-tRNA hydrolase [Spiroplasma taiwanense]AGR41671.1 peptidyl-tRNA hydrolase [Spiroplasma taiwanense CT-1]